MRKALSIFFSIVLVAGLMVPSTAFAQGSSTTGSSSAATTQSSSSASSSSSSSTSASTSSSTAATTASSTDATTLKATTAEQKSAAVQSIAPSSSVDESQEGTSYKEGEVIVVFKDSADSASAKETLADAATVKAGQAEEKTNITDDTVVAKVTDGATVSQAVNELSKDSDVAIVQPNYRYTVLDDGVSSDTAATATAASTSNDLTAQSTTVNDPYTNSDSSYYQWQLSDYVSDSVTTADLGINAFSAWNYSKCSGSVGVAVIDTGCLVTHEDLAANIVAPYNAYNAIYGGSTTDVTDNFGHGTHVCGIIGAVSNNGKGGSGVSYNAKVMPVKACDDSKGYGFYDDELVKSYQYVIANASTYNIRVINMSLGRTLNDIEDTSTWSDEALMQQIDAANSAGILTVCAAGNDNSTNTAYPSDYGTCMSVINLEGGHDFTSGYNAAMRSYGSSNYNASSSSKIKNISAPGEFIWSTTHDGGYGSMSGTSMASPAVAGVAALVFAANSSLTAAECKQIIYDTARDCVYSSTFGEVAGSGWDVYTGYGEVDAAAAVKKALGVGGDLCVSCQTHVQNEGWQTAVTSTPSSIQTSGTTGKALRLEGIKIAVTDASGNALSNVLTYSTHIQNIGWQGYVSQGEMSGTTGKSYRLEAIRIKLTDAYSGNYDVYYRVHAQNIGWMDWASNGEEAGTAGYAYRLEAVQVVIVKKGEAPASTSPSRTTAEHFESIKYRSYLQNYGWKGYVFEGKTSGTAKSLRLEALRISLGTSEYSGSVKYRVYVAGSGWQAWRADGATAGTTGKSKQLGALQVELSGTMASHYDVYYRVRIAGSGWTSWAKDGATAGAANSSTKITAYQVKLVPK